MLGWVTVGESRKRKSEPTELLGLTLWKMELPAFGRNWERRASKGLRSMAAQRVTRVLTASDSPFWPMLLALGFRPVDTCPLRCALVPLWVETMLRARGLEPRTAVLRLEGERVSPQLAQTARKLCPLVRGLTVNAPGGEDLAAALCREFGLPVTPGNRAADLTVSFEDGPLLIGVDYGLNETDLPEDCDALPLICALWQSGRVPLEKIMLKMRQVALE